MEPEGHAVRAVAGRWSLVTGKRYTAYGPVLVVAYYDKCRTATQCSVAVLGDDRLSATTGGGDVTATDRKQTRRRAPLPLAPFRGHSPTAGRMPFASATRYSGATRRLCQTCDNLTACSGQ